MGAQPSSSAADGPSLQTPSLDVAGRIWPTPPESMGLIPPVTRQLTSGLRVVAPANTGQLLSPATAQLALTILAGVGDGKPGLAELVAEAVAENPAGTETGRSLRAAIAGWGGTLTIRVGAHSTTFAMELPHNRWRAALADLASAVSVLPSSRAQLDRIGNQALGRIATEFEADPLYFAVERFLAGSSEGPAAHLVAMADRDITEARVYHSNHYRPAGAVLGVLVPGVSGEQALRDADEIFASWTARPGGSSKPLAQTQNTGIYWSPGERPCRAALIVSQPYPWEPGAAEVRLLQECTTMAGLGGRLERALDQVGASGFLFNDRVLVREGKRHLILEAEIDPANVATLWRLVQDVRASYSTASPSSSELGLAASRSYLIALSEQSNPRLWLETAMWQVLDNREPKPPTELLARLNRPEALDMQAAAVLLENRPFAMVVVGGQPPPREDLPLVLHPGFPQTVDPIQGADLEVQIAAAEAHLERAMQAVGGPDRLRIITGYAATSSTTPEVGPRLEDHVWVTTDRMRRVRAVMATTIETIVTPEESYELSDRERRGLSDLERQTVLVEAHNYPLMLLAAHARGELGFRLVSIRSVGDRTMVILEAVDSRFQRLRMHMDRGSGLVRQVETWQEDATNGAIYARATYSDYRSAGGLRVPFHRRTETNDEVHRQTRWREFKPGRPRDELLLPSGRK
jgi:hypothetical protein